MVVTTCGSCNTLVSLDACVKNNSADFCAACSEEHVFCRSDLLLPEDDFDDEDFTNNNVEQNIYLPSNEGDAVDMCLKSNPQIMETAEELLANAPRYFTSKSPERVLYVAQGELAHAVPSQCDVIASDRATTCHILAVRSTFTSNEPLVSLTHVDGTFYEDCIRNMIQEHKRHYGQSMNCGSCTDEEKKEENKSGDIQMDIHIVGGFEDDKGASRETSNFLVYLLARIASEERNLIRMTLKTCAITSMNDNGYSCPIGRGMGIDLRTGQAFLAQVHSTAAGPCQDLRSVRLWTSPKRLNVIHTAHSDNIIISPFCFQRFQEVDMLLALDDEVLIECTSTSPEVEEDDFCDNVRTSLRYLSNHQWYQVFEQGKPLLYSRVGSSNSWEQC